MLRDLSPAMRITRGIRECHVALALFLLLAGGVRARAEGLPELLQAVATNARFASPARADVRIECGESCNATGTPAIFLGRGEVLYVEVRGGQRVLIRPGEILVAQGGKASAAAPGQTLADTDVLLEDLAVFTPSALKQPQISDDGPAGVVVTAAPAERSSYALLADTIDRERHVIIRTLYYRDLINNLSKTRRDAAFPRSGASWPRARPRPERRDVHAVVGERARDAGHDARLVDAAHLARHGHRVPARRAREGIAFQGAEEDREPLLPLEPLAAGGEAPLDVG